MAPDKLIDNWSSKIFVKKSGEANYSIITADTVTKDPLGRWMWRPAVRLYSLTPSDAVSHLAMFANLSSNLPPSARVLRFACELQQTENQACWRQDLGGLSESFTRIDWIGWIIEERVQAQWRQRSLGLGGFPTVSQLKEDLHLTRCFSLTNTNVKFTYSMNSFLLELCYLCLLKCQKFAPEDLINAMSF